MIMIYFGLFLPFSLVFRIIGRDALQMKRLQIGNQLLAEATTTHRQVPAPITVSLKSIHDQRQIEVDSRHVPKLKNKMNSNRQATKNRCRWFRNSLIFITENKKWWLIPILLVFGLIGLAGHSGRHRRRHHSSIHVVLEIGYGCIPKHGGRNRPATRDQLTSTLCIWQSSV